MQKKVYAKLANVLIACGIDAKTKWSMIVDVLGQRSFLTKFYRNRCFYGYFSSYNWVVPFEIASSQLTNLFQMGKKLYLMPTTQNNTMPKRKKKFNVSFSKIKRFIFGWRSIITTNHGIWPWLWATINHQCRRLYKILFTSHLFTVMTISLPLLKRIWVTNMHIHNQNSYPFWWLIKRAIIANGAKKSLH